jgi:alpha-1,2-mannosyltransferase
VLVAATSLASPHLLDYDLVMLPPAMAFFAAARLDACLGDYEISLLAFIWIAPLLARTVAGMTGIPVGHVAMLALFAVIMRRAIDQRSDPVALGIAQA